VKTKHSTGISKATTVIFWCRSTTIQVSDCGIWSRYFRLSTHHHRHQCHHHQQQLQHFTINHATSFPLPSQIRPTFICAAINIRRMAHRRCPVVCRQRALVAPGHFLQNLPRDTHAST
jgi:hypothetical protein